jgi:hypothetical protein
MTALRHIPCCRGTPKAGATSVGPYRLSWQRALAAVGARGALLRREVFVRVREEQALGDVTTVPERACASHKTRRSECVYYQ